MNAVGVRPEVQILRDEFGTIVDPDMFGLAPERNQTLQHGHHVDATDRLADMRCQALTGVGVDQGQGSEPLAIEQLSQHKNPGDQDRPPRPR